MKGHCRKEADSAGGAESLLKNGGALLFPWSGGEGRVRSSCRAAASLALLYSSAAGVLFAFLFFNLAQYIAASAAINEAARKAVRCISPTDPQCLLLEASSRLDGDQHWFGYQEPGGGKVDVFLDYYRYQGGMPQQVWGADYQVFEVHRVKQPVTWISSAVPIRRYTPVIAPDSGAYQLDFNFPYFSPPSGAVFPGFEQDASSSRDVWQRKMPFTFEWQDFQAAVPSGQTHRFITQDIEIPVLEGAEGVPCFDAAWNICDAASLAGGAFAPDKWRSYAYLAIKVIGKIDPLTGSPSVNWGAPGEDGLYAFITDPDTGKTRREELGGRIWMEVPRGGFGYDLWLRGPAGAHGGIPSQPHHNLAVKRGGKVRIQANLSARGGAVASKVSIGWYYDTYSRQEKTVTCAPVEFHGAAPQSCPGKEQCSPQGPGFNQVPEKLYGNWRSSCSVMQDYPGDGSSRAQESRDKAVTALWCNDSWRPQTVDPGLLPAGWKQTSWVIEDAGTAFLPGQNGSCGAASEVRHEEFCSSDPIAGDTIPVRQCPNIEQQLMQLEQRARYYNSLQPAGAPSFETAASAENAEPRNSYWEFSWLPLDESGRKLDESRGQVRSVQLSLSEAGAIRRFVRADGAQEPPAPRSLGLAIFAENRGRSEKWWSAYLAGIDKYAVPKRLGTSLLNIDGVYPFMTPVPEIYWGQTDPSRGWDFNLDCLPDASCEAPGAARYRSEEALLRQYAARQVPEAADPSYRFEYTAERSYTEYQGERVRSTKKSSMLQCTPARTVCPESPGAAAKLVDLGLSHELPEACRAGTYKHCFSRSEGHETVASEAHVQLDEQKLQEIALDQLKRIMPSASACGGLPGCAAVRAEIGGNTASVTVAYEMPLNFPLNLLSGKESVTLSTTKEEQLERAGLSRMMAISE